MTLYFQCVFIVSVEKLDVSFIYTPLYVTCVSGLVAFKICVCVCVCVCIMYLCVNFFLFIQRL